MQIRLRNEQVRANRPISRARHSVSGARLDDFAGGGNSASPGAAPPARVDEFRRLREYFQNMVTTPVKDLRLLAALSKNAR